MNKATDRKPAPRFAPNRIAMAVSGALLWGSCLAPAMAQDATPAKPAAQGGSIDEVIVTGTLIRGAEVTGSQSINVDAEAMQAIGAFSNNDLLSRIAQVTNTFNQRPDASPRNTLANTVTRPNLRGLPGFTAASGSTTLVLIDGHRGAPLGLIESSFDPDMISGGVVERVEIVTDGGSSLYGADAVGGVINFITRDEFDGVKIDLGYGSGDDFDQHEVSLTAGTSWKDGSGYVSFSQSHRDNIQNQDRDWAMLGTYQADGSLTPNGTECLQPAGSEQRWYFYQVGAVSGWTNNPAAPGTGVFPVGQPCDVQGASSMIPEKDLRNAFFSVKQQLTERIGFSLKGYYGERTNNYSHYPLGDTISGPTPAQLGLGAADGYTSGDLYAQPSLGFSYGANAAYSQRDRETDMDTWGITPEFTVELGNGWQLRNTFYYGKSNTDYVEPDSNFLLASAYVKDGTIDPSNIAAAPASVINDILDWKIAGETEQEMYSARIVADGALFNLPAGELRAAFGLEYQDDSASTRQAFSGITYAGWGGVGDRSESRDVKSAFVEFSVPVFSMLDLSLSVRRDEYSDFGNTTNPNYGFKFTPLDWIRIYGHIGESFNAPTLLDSLATSRSRNTPDQWSASDPLNEFCLTSEANAGQCSPPGNKGVMQLLGTGNVKPQTADNWAVGFDIQPPVIEGLTLRANYWEIDFMDALGAVNPLIDQAVISQHDKFIFNPTQAVFDQYLGYIENSAETSAYMATLNANGLPGAIVDRRTSNVDEYKLRGVDFGFDYLLDCSCGSFLFSLSGVKYLESTAIQAGGKTDLLEANVQDLDMVGSIGWSLDAMSARLTMSYTDAYDVTGTPTGQNSVDSYLLTDLYMGYNFEGGGIMDGLSLRFFVDNVFDEDPPAFERNNAPPLGFTLGRTFRIGVSKTFN